MSKPTKMLQKSQRFGVNRTSKYRTDNEITEKLGKEGRDKFKDKREKRNRGNKNKNKKKANVN